MTTLVGESSVKNCYVVRSGEAVDDPATGTASATGYDYIHTGSGAAAIQSVAVCVLGNDAVTRPAGTAHRV
ncbi:hypothetical protein C444_15668 [Haloarcula japonica DSM 6131]|uniref:Uncharacterized protein n=1 Tax=Haloarcula japonica (strain ATCC 49778 / DSM 6131 / JCM 7785 / NBRC 101032 / NCIMB 13157 / TR-1) TaxID=1227453 RepID=M0L6T2_HALJT|nr:hypothetical protein C444_15668 [Haloarcula japonica DSM 6131]